MSREMSSAPISRQLQRNIGALKIAADTAFANEEPTLPSTIHASADLMEWLALEGGALFRDYPAKVRRRMATEGRALPDGSFPIADCSDASDAIRSIGRAKADKRAKAEAHIRKRVRALGCSGSIYENWK